MWSFKQHILLFFSVILFSSIGRSNNNHTTSSQSSKSSCCQFISNYSSDSTISTITPVNTYTRNRRSTKEDDHRFFSDLLTEKKIFHAKPITLTASHAEHRLSCFCTDLIPSRAPPIFN